MKIPSPGTPTDVAVLSSTVGVETVIIAGESPPSVVEAPVTTIEIFDCDLLI